MVKTTRAQRVALFKVFQRDFPGWLSPGTRTEHTLCPNCGFHGDPVKVSTKQWRGFRSRVQDGPGCIMVPWRDMWLGIEPDGYTHS